MQFSCRLNDRLAGRVFARVEIEYQPVGLPPIGRPDSPRGVA